MAILAKQTRASWEALHVQRGFALSFQHGVPIRREGCIFSLHAGTRGQEVLKKLTFKKKIGLMVAIAVIGVAFLTIINALSVRRVLVEGRQAELARAVEALHTVVAGYQAKAAAGQMTEAEAQKAAKDAARLSRFGGADGKTNYFYIWTLKVEGVMHPIKPEWEGQAMVGKIKDSDGMDVIATLVRAIEQSPTGRAYVEMHFPKPGSNAPVPKLQYVVKVDGWNWLIGSGLYLDDLNAEIWAEVLQRSVIACMLLVVFSGTGFLVARAVLQQLGGDPAEAIEVMNEVAKGNLVADLGQRLPGSLLHALDGMQHSLRTTVSRVRTAADSMNLASMEIASGNQDLSGRTEQAASSLQETASAMEQLTATVQQSSDAALQAQQLAVGANEVAIQGGAAIADVMQTMERINASARKVVDIIGVIDGIAFQTNILALNAAVEAARAGEQGRGFAVVAAEVRSLATRSAQAAKEIKSLIDESVEGAESGAALVKGACATIQDIQHAVQRVKDIIGEISVAAREQSGGIGQVNTAVSELERMTQQNAALVEQSAAAAMSLKDQSHQLAAVVQIFRT